MKDLDHEALWLVLLYEVRQSGAHTPIYSVTECDALSLKEVLVDRSCTCTLRKSGKLFLVMSVMEKKANPNACSFCAYIPGDRSAQKNVRSGF